MAESIFIASAEHDFHFHPIRSTTRAANLIKISEQRIIHSINIRQIITKIKFKIADCTVSFLAAQLIFPEYDADLFALFKR